VVGVLKFIVAFFLMTSGHLLLAQSDVPWSYRDRVPSVSQFQVMPAWGIRNEAGRHSSDRSVHKEGRFAHPFDTKLSPANSGEWTFSKSGMVWRLGIVSNGAYAIYITCQLQANGCNGQLYLYGPQYRQLSGPFQLSDLPSAFSLPAIAGDTLMVEINIENDTYLDDCFTINRVWHDYVNVLGNKNKHLQKSASDACDENIQCSNGVYWQTEKRAVCKIVSDGQLSTGTLIGNTSGSNVPFVLTSRHTMFDEEHAAQALFYFNDETLGCNNNETAEPQVMVGSTLVWSTDVGFDCALLRLHEVPPRSFMPYYAGWSRSSRMPSGGVCIHHPWGKAKQIAIEYHQPVVGSFNDKYAQNAFWHIPHWEIGTTSHGSSGAPLFDTNHRLIGTLTGGRASCSRPVDDYFCRFDLAWDAPTTTGGTLADWLDAKMTHVESIAGYDPYGTDADLCEPAWNVYPDYSQMKYASLALDPSAPQKLAERFFLNGSLRIAGLFLPVGLVELGDPLAQIQLKIWQGDEMPEHEVYSQTVFLQELNASEVNEVRLDSFVAVTGNFFVGVAAMPTMSNSRLALGYLPRLGLASSTLLAFNGSWSSDGSVCGNSSLCMGVRACDGKIAKVPPSVLSVFPNPCTNFFRLVVPGGVVVESVGCFDLLGRNVEVEHRWDEEGIAVSFNLPQGNYILKLCTQSAVFHAKFTVSKL
jgi:lysyl endopeptidase